MIRNERQLAVARDRLRELEQSAMVADDPVAHRSYAHLIADITHEISEYLDIKHGRVRHFAIHNLDDLGEAVIKARIARNLNHRQLAEELGVTEQMVQKDEARIYETAGLARLAEIMDVLEYELVGAVRPKGQKLPMEDATSTSVAQVALRGYVPPLPVMSVASNVQHGLATTFAGISQRRLSSPSTTTQETSALQSNITTYEGVESGR